MRVVKYFHEEPASLELLASGESPASREPAEAMSLEAFLRAPKYYRGYLAASDLKEGLTGATALNDPSVWLNAVLEMLATETAYRSRPGADAFSTVGLAEALSMGQTSDLLAVGPGPAPELNRIEGDLRQRLSAVRPLMDAGFTILIAEPATDAVDWSFFSAQPMAGRLRTAFQSAGSDAARFVIPHLKARAEHKFYFERYDLGLFEEFRVPSP
ncbi:MAG: hypothetical protein ACI80V_001973 [Rhodothermales bacterium]|jgi:hypothetical protein